MVDKQSELLLVGSKVLVCTFPCLFLWSYAQSNTEKQNNKFMWTNANFTYSTKPNIYVLATKRIRWALQPFVWCKTLWSVWLQNWVDSFMYVHWVHGCIKHQLTNEYSRKFGLFEIWATSFQNFGWTQKIVILISYYMLLL